MSTNLVDSDHGNGYNGRGGSDGGGGGGGGDDIENAVVALDGGGSIVDREDSSSAPRKLNHRRPGFQESQANRDGLQDDEYNNYNLLSTSNSNASSPARVYRRIVCDDSGDDDDTGRYEVGDAERTHHELLRTMEEKIKWLNEIVGSLERLLEQQGVVEIEEENEDEEM